MKNLLKVIIATLVLATISGCTGYGVTFQSAPSTQLSDCYPALVGDWRVIEGERNAPTSDEDFLSVSPDCSAIMSITFKTESGKQSAKVDNMKDGKNGSIQFAQGSNYDYVVISPKESSFEITKEITLPSGKIIYQINKGKDGVILRSVDLDKTAQLVLQKKISGQLYIDNDAPDGRSASNIYVRGDQQKIAGYLENLDVYSDKRLLLIPANPKEIKQIQKAIKNNGKEK
ncbi:MAG: hypothetical protein ABI644_04410 [Arenimonas sp.]